MSINTAIWWSKYSKSTIWPYLWRFKSITRPYLWRFKSRLNGPSGIVLGGIVFASPSLEAGLISLVQSRKSLKQHLTLDFSGIFKTTKDRAWFLRDLLTQNMLDSYVIFNPKLKRPSEIVLGTFASPCLEGGTYQSSSVEAFPYNSTDTWFFWLPQTDLDFWELF
jgi:hypothetical protein